MDPDRGPDRAGRRLTELVEGLRTYRANRLVDADGRPLGEVSSPRWDPDRTEVVACPYPDRRAGRPMNRTALRQVSPVWPELLATFRALAGPSPTVHRAWRAALVGLSAPLLVPEPVPVVLSALYKTSLGLSQVTTDLLLAEDGVADAPFASLGDGEAFFDALDRGGWLLGQVQVCAGTRAMFVQLGEALAGAPGEARLTPALPDDPERIADVAALALADHALDALGAPGSPLPPWLRALVAVPDRPLAHVRRLFPTGATPPAIERRLALAS